MPAIVKWASLDLEELLEFQTSMKRSEEGYRKYGFNALADDYVQTLVEIEAALAWKKDHA